MNEIRILSCVVVGAVNLENNYFPYMEKKVAKMKKEGCKKGCKLGSEQPSLTEHEAKVLHSLTKDFLTIKQCSSIYNCSTQAIYKIKKSLVSKGFLHAKVPQEMKVAKSRGGLQPLQPLQPFSAEPKNSIRLHAEQFVIDILWKQGSYSSGQMCEIDGNTIRLNERSIEVYSNTSFFSDTASGADAKALRYWYRLFNRLQERFKVILLKNNYMNIRRVKAEYAETNNELAKKFVDENKRVRVFGEDGKQWLVFDDSFNLHEAETTHSRRSKEDMENVVQPFFNDLRRNPVTLTDVLEKLNTLAQENIETARGLQAAVKLITPAEKKDEEDFKEKKMWYHG